MKAPIKNKENKCNAAKNNNEIKKQNASKFFGFESKSFIKNKSERDPKKINIE